MPSTIITIVIAFAIALLFRRKYIFLVFSLATLALIVPVRWVVFPVSEYLAAMSAKQIFDDIGYVLGESFANVFSTLGGGEVEAPLAIIGFIGVGFILNLFGLGFHAIKNQEPEKTQ